MSFGEGNPFTDITGGFSSLLKKMTDAIAALPCHSESKVSQKNAVTDDYPENVLICTELPPFKSAVYGQLSDYFYIWLRRSLQHIYPELFKQTVTPKCELSTAPECGGKTADDSQAEYVPELEHVCKKLCSASTEQYPALLFADYHTGDEAAIRRGEKTTWGNRIAALLSAGFSISTVLPLWERKPSSNASGGKFLIVCKKTREASLKATRRGFISTFKNEYPARLDSLLRDVDPQDQRILAIGCGLQIYSRYHSVINADGTNMSTHDALQIILQEMDEYFALPVCNAQNVEDSTREG